MEYLLEIGVEIGVSAVLGLLVGYLVGAYSGRSKETEPTATESAPVEEDSTDWWELRKTLTGTQLQILQYLEETKEASITNLQEKFSFIPDRELYYRLEQIHLMGFLLRERKDGEVTYALNPEYMGTVEEDKTVMLSSGKD